MTPTTTSLKALSTAPFHPASSPDYVPREHLRRLQSQRLRDTVRRAYDRVGWYRQRMDQRELKPDRIRTVEDLALLPLTVKSDLRENYPFGLFAATMGQIVRLHASAGTTGKPIVVAYTRNDLDAWTEIMVRVLACCGIQPGDVIQNAFGYGLFAGGLGFHYGGEALGATVIPISGAHTDRQIAVMKDFGVSAICSTPSDFLHIIDRAEEMGVDLRKLALRVGVFGAEPWTEALRTRIEEAAGIKAYDIYGLSEMIGPGVAAECHVQQGLHLFEDHFYPEIIDPETRQPLPDGQEGELVLTTLGKEAMPLIRFRTRDITAILPEPCPCGRTLRRIRRITHGGDEMFVYRGMNVFPSQIEAALVAVEGTLPRYQIVLSRDKGVDQVELRVEVTPAVFSDRVSALEGLEEKIARQIENSVGIRAHVSLVEPHTIPRTEGRAKRVVDQRQL
ncbi:MAG: phenylacetate--CoA ligase [Thermoguttaceae bacterium]|jgi:phenylacetate-CoA ligase|nr:phenylacetate--CoA ligase [Thermoguttaceae bacterium]